MSLQSKILNPSAPVTFFEMVPPAAHKPEAIVQTLEEAKEVRDLADAINLPEIYEEDRGKKRQERFLPRVAPRELGVRIQRELGTEVVINRVVVREPDQDRWFRAA